MNLEWDDRDTPCTIEAYRRSRKRLTEGTYSESEIPHVNAMIRDIDYALEWMETGRRPGNKRGVERLAAYQREIPVDIMERYAAPPTHLTIQTDDSLEWEYRKMEYILSLLTDRERQCYEMNVGGMYSEREIAQMIGIAQPTVHENLKRAQNKIKQYKSRPMPLLLEIVV